MPEFSGLLIVMAVAFAVPFLLDESFDSVLSAPHEGHLYPRLGHGEVDDDHQVLERIHTWYAAHGLF